MYGFLVVSHIHKYPGLIKKLLKFSCVQLLDPYENKLIPDLKALNFSLLSTLCYYNKYLAKILRLLFVATMGRCTEDTHISK